MGMFDDVTRSVILIEVRDEGTGKLTKITKQVDDLDKASGKLVSTTQNVNAKTGEVYKTTTRTTTGLRLFRMEMLGIMFGAQSVAAAFGAVAQAGFEMFSVSELLGLTWGLLMLPIMELLIEPLLTILQAFWDMPEPMKKVVGAGILLFFVLFTLLSIFGMMTLFLTSLGQVSWIAAA